MGHVFQVNYMNCYNIRLGSVFCENRMPFILFVIDVNTFFLLGSSHYTGYPYFLTNVNKLCSDCPTVGCSEVSGKEIVDINSCYGAAELHHLEFTGKVEKWNYPRGCIVLADHTEAKFNVNEVGQRHPHVGQVCKKTGKSHRPSKANNQ